MALLRPPALAMHVQRPRLWHVQSRLMWQKTDLVAFNVAFDNKDAFLVTIPLTESRPPADRVSGYPGVRLNRSRIVPNTCLWFPALSSVLTRSAR
jgi:hypothetical protein